jgi:hypothetical protein
MTVERRPIDDRRRAQLDLVTATADRFDALADVAELMGDLAGAEQLRCRAAAAREQAMSILDDR